MLTGPSLSRFRSRLLSWFAQSRRDLPWRRTKDSYRIWVSEIMLQQTRVTAVVPYYERFLGYFPDVRALADAPEEEVLRQWAGLGYYSRARNLQKAAQKIVKEHDSRFPNDLEKALGLPGIGPYTAPAILSIAHGRKLAVLDGNVARVLARLGSVRGDLRGANQWQKLQDAADTLLAPRAPGDWNQAMMELGATLCTPRSPQCLLCPIAEFCRARKLGLSEIIPAKRNKRAKVEITLAALVLTDPQGRTLLLPPPDADAKQKSSVDPDVPRLLSRMWHFPTVLVRDNAEAELRTFVARNIFGKRAIRGEFQPLQRVRHAVTYRQITVQSFRLDIAKLPAIPGTKMLPLDNLSSVPISNLTRKVARVALPDRPEPPLERAQNEMLSF